MSALVYTRCTAPECNAEIIMVASERTGRAAPIDREPAAGGNIEIDYERAVYRIKRDPARADLHFNHFYTCPARERFRVTVR